MRIIDPHEYAELDYQEAVAKGISSTIRPPGIVVEEYLGRWDGPPSHILWAIDYDGSEIRGYSVPYETLDRREEGVAELLGLTEPGLTYSSSPPGIRPLHTAWLKTPTLPWSPNPYKMLYGEPVETILATPRFVNSLMKLSRKGKRFSTLKRVILFIGCEFTTTQDIMNIEALFGPEVIIRLVYYRAWTGIIATTTTDMVLQDYEVGAAIPGLSVLVARGNHITLKGARVQNIKMLTKDRIVDFSGQWVPTCNAGSMGPNGELFVSGYVSGGTQRKTTQTDIVPPQQKRD